jgi:hypothetical protein
VKRVRGTHFWIAACSAAIVALVAVGDLGRSSPGELSAVHARLEELAGRNDCSACHGGFLSDMSDSCLECHADIQAHIEEQRGLHGLLVEGVQQCGLCHGEHHGAGSPLVNRQSFALAGVSRLEEFDHGRIGFPMDGAHLALDCAECHTSAHKAVLREDEWRWVGLDQDCASCHEDVHEGRFVLACASCHGQETWDGLNSLGHEEHLPLLGGHGGLSCLECHAGESGHGLELLGGRGRKPPARACQDCHPSPHAPGFVGGLAASLALEPEAACVTCHAAEHESFRDERLALTPEQHAFSGFPLEPPHAAPACADCHPVQDGSGLALDFPARYPGRGAAQCSRCHEDVHGGQFDQGPFAGQECTACHAREAFLPHAFTVETHALAALPLEGAHVESACYACHEDPTEVAPRLFRGTPTDCDACHADAHDGFFRPFAAGLAAVEHGECARCHDAASFSAVPEQRFDHGRWTGFPVDGAHAQERCEVCHPRAEQPDPDGRTFGRISEHFGAFTGCVTCHADPHVGWFDGPGHPSEFEGRTGCERCHATSSFRSFPRGFDHGFWTGFTLAGAHSTAGCSACHAPLLRPDELGRTWTPARGSACSDCHGDPHAGQFRDAEGTDCARCHTDDLPSFSSFDHERDARFPLGEAHGDLACETCHPSTTQRGLAVVRYRPLPSECVDCHGAQEEVLLRRTPRRRP